MNRARSQSTPPRTSALVSFIMGTGALVLASCSAAPAVRHLVPDQDSLSEVGRAYEFSELTMAFYRQYQPRDPTRWNELARGAGDLYQHAGQMVMARVRAVAGSSDDAANFYDQLGERVASLRSEREKLTADLLAAVEAAR